MGVAAQIVRQPVFHQPAGVSPVYRVFCFGQVIGVDLQQDACLRQFPEEALLPMKVSVALGVRQDGLPPVPGSNVQQTVADVPGALVAPPYSRNSSSR